MELIASFKVDHDRLEPGIYVSRVDGDVTTYDLRTRKPNSGDYMDNITMHSVEHMLATLLRSSEIGGSVVYFGPMGCRTGFYLLVRNADNETVLRVLRECLVKTAEHKGRVFGQARKQCGNWKELSAASARREAKRYLKTLDGREQTFAYE
ncbi:MAG: S-ribosylhomocysteine lyase [Clostridia bacterium]|nr:S-ribosylhomocysteine lyase [Clostridia bacterium]MBR5767909.1 S-ribosylhomocysteine lyase [Clostridia bacterium]